MERGDGDRAAGIVDEAVDGVARAGQRGLDADGGVGQCAAGGGEDDPRPARSVKGTAIVRCSNLSCCEIADGVTNSASATAVTLPSSPSSRSTRSCRSSISTM